MLNVGMSKRLRRKSKQRKTNDEIDGEKKYICKETESERDRELNFPQQMSR